MVRSQLFLCFADIDPPPLIRDATHLGPFSFHPSLLAIPSTSTSATAFSCQSQPSATPMPRISLCIDSRCYFTDRGGNGLARSLFSWGRRLAKYLYRYKPNLRGGLSGGIFFPATRPFAFLYPISWCDIRKCNSLIIIEIHIFQVLATV